MILITQESPFARYIASQIANQTQLDGIVVTVAPPPRPKGVNGVICRMLGPKRYRQLTTTKQWLSSSGLEKQVAKIEQRLKQEALDWFLQTVGDTPAWPPTVPLLTTAKVNGPECVAWCRAKQPQFLLVYGAPILRKNLLGVPSVATLNSHGSLLPEYRGSGSGFWQCVQQDYQHVGVTVHFVDAGVDTGQVVLQQPIAANDQTSHFDIYVRCALAAAKLLPAAAAKVRADPQCGILQGEPRTPVFRSRDVTLGKRVELLTRLGHLK